MREVRREKEMNGEGEDQENNGRMEIEGIEEMIGDERKRKRKERAKRKERK